jgi:hypothetical protein
VDDRDTDGVKEEPSLANEGKLELPDGENDGDKIQDCDAALAALLLTVVLDVREGLDPTDREEVGEALAVPDGDWEVDPVRLLLIVTVGDED